MKTRLGFFGGKGRDEVNIEVNLYRHKLQGGGALWFCRLKWHVKGELVTYRTPGRETRSEAKQDALKRVREILA